MNNEPVAWMYRMRDSANKWELIFNKPINDEFFETIPLYTHPVKTPTLVLDGNRVYATVKTLTDEEIDEVLYSMDWAHDPVDFARAILRKAQEK